jgi:hypothetical protein
MASSKPPDLERSTDILKTALVDLIFSSQNKQFKYKLLAKLNIHEDSKLKLESRIGCLLDELIDKHYGVIELDTDLSDASEELDINKPIEDREITLSDIEMNSCSSSDLEIIHDQERQPLFKEREINDTLEDSILKECDFAFKKDDYDFLQ